MDADLIPHYHHQGPESRAVTLWASKQVAVQSLGIRHKMPWPDVTVTGLVIHRFAVESEGGVRTTERSAATRGRRRGPACPAHPAVAITLDRKQTRRSLVVRGEAENLAALSRLSSWLPWLVSSHRCLGDVLLVRSVRPGRRPSLLLLTMVTVAATHV